MQNQFIKYLANAFTKELPGIEAHRKLVPPGCKLEPSSDEFLKVKHSGVLFLLFPEDTRLFTCLIKRPASMKHHPGQIGFPGGQVETCDPSPRMTAMREAEEEVGLNPGSYKIVGKLSDLYIQVSNFIIHPYIAWTDQKPHFWINESEVEKIILFPVQDFMENGKLEETELNTFTGTVMVPYYPFNSEIVWGATAMILSEFFELTRYYQPVPG
jgi:8-oxo-dGTP pyrophosphatase MutT (NUDIX family)